MHISVEGQRSPRLSTACAFALATTLAVGCKTVYVPNTVNVPLLLEKGEVRATLDQKNLQAAYAVADGVGLLANGFYQGSDPDSQNESGQGGRGYLVELGAGHFRPLGDGAVFETYGGLGYGSVRHDNWETLAGTRSNYRFSASAVKAFVQPSFGMTRTFFDAAAAVRFVALKPFDVTATNYPQERLQQDDLFGVAQRTWVFVEPAVTLRAGYKWVKLFLQYGHSFKLNETPLNRDETFVAIGLHVDLAARLRGD